MRDTYEWKGRIRRKIYRFVVASWQDARTQRRAECGGAKVKKSSISDLGVIAPNILCIVYIDTARLD